MSLSHTISPECTRTPELRFQLFFDFLCHLDTTALHIYAQARNYSTKQNSKVYYLVPDLASVATTLSCGSKKSMNYYSNDQQ